MTVAIARFLFWLMVAGIGYCITWSGRPWTARFVLGIAMLLIGCGALLGMLGAAYNGLL